ncbi:hypothetical protein ACFFRR_010298 [Megaselia abdita]
MSRKITVFFFIAFGFLATYSFAWRSFEVILSRVEYKGNKDFVDLKMEIQNNTGDTALNAHINVLNSIDDIILKFEVLMEATEGNFTSVLKRNVHFCKFLKSHSIDPVLRIIYEDIIKYGNLMKTCPIKKGIFYLHDYRIDEEMLPSYVPEANFNIVIELYFPNEVKLATVKIHGFVDKSKGFNNLKMFSLG